MSFAELGLSARSLAALDRAGFEAPTPIQTRAIPSALQGKDVIGCAATGTGKTAAFLLPILERLARPHPTAKRGTRALVLAPTRELALQIGAEAQRFGTHGKDHAVRSAVVIGGVGMGPQSDAFRMGVELIIATPGRLNDHLDRGTARLDAIEVLVLDEADRMLDMGFKPQLDRILAKVPRVRQTMRFSATMAGEVADFAARHLKEAVRVDVGRSGATAERATQQVFLVGQEEKLALLLALLGEDELSTLVFTRTKRRADRVAKALAKAGHAAGVIHADRSQGQRRAALEGFKDGTHRVLVATDIAARGIDVAEDYVHRIGRTARAEASGRASSFAAPDEHDLLRGIEKLTRKTVDRAKVPRDTELFQSNVQATHSPARDDRRPQRSRPPARQHARRSSGSSSSSGSSPAPEGKSLGSWKPRRRR